MPDPTTPAKGLTQPTVGADNNTWGGLLNTDLSLIDAALGGTLTLSIAGNTTLNSTQIENTGYEFTGTLSGNATITWPSFSGMAAIQNATTGGFSIVCGVSGATVTVLNGESVAIWSDGTDFVSLAQTGGGIRTYQSYDAFGDSITAGYAASTPAKDYVNLIGTALAITPTNHGVSATGSVDQFDYIYPFSVSTSTSQLITYMIGINDAYTYGGDLNKEANFGTFDKAELAFLAIPAANKLLGQSSGITYSGTWSNSSTYGGAISKQSTTNGSTATFEVYGKTVYIAHTLRDSNDGQFSVTIDGSSIGTFNATGIGGAAILNNFGRTYGSSLLRFGGLTEVLHTVVVTVTSATGAGNIVQLDWVATPDGNRLPGGPVVIAGGITRNTDSDPPPFYAYDTYVLDNVTQLSADGLNVLYVDTAPHINPATDIISDGTHPNDSGMQHIADAFLYAINVPDQPRAPEGSSTLGDVLWLDRVNKYLGINTQTPYATLTVNGPVALAGVNLAPGPAIGSDGSHTVITGTSPGGVQFNSHNNSTPTGSIDDTGHMSIGSVGFLGPVTAGPSISTDGVHLVLTGTSSGIQFNSHNNSTSTGSIDDTGHMSIGSVGFLGPVTAGPSVSYDGTYMVITGTSSGIAFNKHDNSAIVFNVTDDGSPSTVPLRVTNGGTGDTGTAWSTYTPTLGSGTGSLTSASATGRYKTIGKTVFVEIVISITTNGTATGYLTATLPVAVTGHPYVVAGRENGINGKMLQFVLDSGVSSTFGRLYNFDNSYPGGDGTVMYVSGMYESV